MKKVLLLLTLLPLAACTEADGGGGISDARAVLIEACDTQQGAQWLRDQYGEDYCACWADRAREELDDETYTRLVEAASDELAAGSDAEREAIARDAVQAYAQASDAAQGACTRGG